MFDRLRARPWRAAAAPVSAAARAVVEALEPRRLLSAYFLDVLADTGDASADGQTLSSFADPTIDEAGRVAFSARSSSGEGLFVTGAAITGPPAPVARLTGSPSSARSYSAPRFGGPGAAAAIFRNVVVGSGTFDALTIYDTAAPGSSRTVVSDTTAQPPAPNNLGRFQSLDRSGLSDSGILAFVGETLTSPASGSMRADSLFTVPAGGGRNDVQFNYTYVDEPGVVRVADGPGGPVLLTFDGNGPTDGRYVLDGPGGGAATLFDTGGSMFSALGTEPGLSDDGNYIGFYGDLTAAGAAATGLKPGEGIFLYDLASQKVSRLAGVAFNGFLDPGERGDDNGDGTFDTTTEIDEGRFNSFNPTGGIGVGVDANRVTVAFLASDITDAEGVWTAMTDPPGPFGLRGLTFPISHRLVADATSDLGPQIGPDVTFQLNDPVNDLHQVAFTATSGGESAVVRGRPGNTVVLAIGIQDTMSNPGGPSGLQGDVDAQNFSDEWELQVDGVQVEVPLLRFDTDAGGAFAARDAFQSLHLVPNEQLVVMFSTHGGYDRLTTGNEPNATPPDPNDPNAPPPRINSTADEYIYFGADKSDAGRTLYDDDLATAFNNSKFNAVDKLFVMDLCFAGGYWQNNQAASDLDLAGLPRAAIFAAASENDYGLAIITADPTDLIYGTGRLTNAVQQALRTLGPAGPFTFDQLRDQTAASTFAFAPDGSPLSQFTDLNGQIKAIGDRQPDVAFNAQAWDDIRSGADITFAPFFAQSPDFDFAVGDPLVQPVGDLTPPTVTAGPAFEFEAGQAVVVTFGEDVAGSVDPGDLTVRLTAGGPAIVATAVAYDAAALTARFTFAGPLGNGDYTATLAAGSVADAAGNVLAADATGTFFVLAGDADRNRRVDSDDIERVRLNFGRRGVTFSQGDVNGDGRVTLADYRVVRGALGTNLEVIA